MRLDMGTHDELVVDEIIRRETLEHIDIDDSDDDEEMIPEAIFRRDTLENDQYCLMSSYLSVIPYA